MSSCISALRSPTAQKIYGATIIGFNIINYIGHGINDSVMLDVAEQVSKVYKGNVTVTTFVGNFTSRTLPELITVERSISGVLTWAIPAITIGLGTLSIWANCTRKSTDYEQVTTMDPLEDGWEEVND